MKWVSVNNGTSEENFELWNDDTKLANISFSKSTRIARFVSNLTKRLFFFEKRGWFSRKAIIKNEYGIKMGNVEELKAGAGKGFVEVDGRKYYFVYNQNNSGELELYDESMQKSLLHCSFNTLTTGFNKTKSLLDSKFPSLLMVLCWYAFQPHSATTAADIAA
ncbi:hypothetical protein [Ferruginibacter sp. SUN106]|uniref:hypothetical protein n=1 Tax=Ferruginibacter sp. SUN106 TaxID=2978348 RepID=UPI003D360185